jgi:2-keto-4-pentenoate hydratase
MTHVGGDQPDVRDGMQRMLSSRSEYLHRGDTAIGWKLGFGATTWLEKFGLAGPLVGFLPQSTRHDPGAEVSCEGWINPVAEPEIAVHLGSDVDDPSRASEAISGLGAAIELADVDSPPEDIGEVLAGNIFHRAVILGEAHPGITVSGMRARIQKNGAQVADTTDLESLTGQVVPILGHAAALLEAAGEHLRAGDVIIMGSVIPPISIEPGDEITFELAPLDPISVKV